MCIRDRYNSLPEEQQLAVSAVPPDLLEESGLVKTEDAEAVSYTHLRDKIPDYYEHIRQSKQEKLFHEAIFQIGNLTDCCLLYTSRCV